MSCAHTGECLRSDCSEPSTQHPLAWHNGRHQVEWRHFKSSRFCNSGVHHSANHPEHSYRHRSIELTAAGRYASCGWGQKKAQTMGVEPVTSLSDGPMPPLSYVDKNIRRRIAVLDIPRTATAIGEVASATPDLEAGVVEMRKHISRKSYPKQNGSATRRCASEETHPVVAEYDEVAIWQSRRSPDAASLFPTASLNFWSLKTGSTTIASLVLHVLHYFTGVQHPASPQAELELCHLQHLAWRRQSPSRPPSSFARGASASATTFNTNMSHPKLHVSGTPGWHTDGTRGLE